MNLILQSLHERKSVRAYENRAISAACKNEILQAAMAAPTAGNQQLYTILDITDGQVKDKLAVSCDNQPFIAQAPLVLIFCADVQKWVDVFRAGGAKPRKAGVGDLMLAMQDAVIAAQNAVVAAQSLGIGSCYIGDILEKCAYHRALLHLPETVLPACMLVFGYPTAQQLARTKPQRCKLEDIVCENFYVPKTDAQLRCMFEKETHNRSFEAWAQAFCERKYNADFSVEMTRSVAEYLQAFSD
ncbi:MAG: nitroreductase family protein [Ruthenibacterium sp.]